jgi:hypothetical protein
MPVPSESTSGIDLSLTLDVEDLAGVERVIGLLRIRRYDLRRLDATLGPDGTWVVALVVQKGAPGAERLIDRLDRLVPVAVHQPCR